MANIVQRQPNRNGMKYVRTALQKRGIGHILKHITQCGFQRYSVGFFPHMAISIGNTEDDHEVFVNTHGTMIEQKLVKWNKEQGRWQYRTGLCTPLKYLEHPFCWLPEIQPAGYVPLAQLYLLLRAEGKKWEKEKLQIPDINDLEATLVRLSRTPEYHSNLLLPDLNVRPPGLDADGDSDMSDSQLDNYSMFGTNFTSIDAQPVVYKQGLRGLQEAVGMSLLSRLPHPNSMVVDDSASGSYFKPAVKLGTYNGGRVWALLSKDYNHESRAPWMVYHLHLPGQVRDISWMTISTEVDLEEPFEKAYSDEELKSVIKYYILHVSTAQSYGNAANEIPVNKTFVENMITVCNRFEDNTATETDSSSEGSTYSSSGHSTDEEVQKKVQEKVQEKDVFSKSELKVLRQEVVTDLAVIEKNLHSTRKEKRDKLAAIDAALDELSESEEENG